MKRKKVAEERQHATMHLSYINDLWSLKKQQWRKMSAHKIRSVKNHWEQHNIQLYCVDLLRTHSHSQMLFTPLNLVHASDGKRYKFRMNEVNEQKDYQIWNCFFFHSNFQSIVLRSRRSSMNGFNSGIFLDESTKKKKVLEVKKKSSFFRSPHDIYSNPPTKFTVFQYFFFFSLVPKPIQNQIISVISVSFLFPFIRCGSIFELQSMVSVVLLNIWNTQRPFIKKKKIIIYSNCVCIETDPSICLL